MSDPLVSVIVPIYNSFKYLPTSLESLHQQDLSSAQFILANDGSSDNSLQIMRKYAEKDPRFEFLDFPHQGTGKTRNMAMKSARGKYIICYDPDDYYSCNNVLSSLYKQAESQNCDMIVFNYNIMDESGNVIKECDIAENLKSTHILNNVDTFNWRNIKGKIFEALSFSA